jgi:hypothetical protein
LLALYHSRRLIAFRGSGDASPEKMGDENMMSLAEPAEIEQVFNLHVNERRFLFQFAPGRGRGRLGALYRPAR